MYQLVLARVDATAGSIVERPTERIDANGQRIDRLGERVERNSVLIARIGERVDRNAELIRQNAERIDRNGELILQPRERMTAVEVRVGGLEEVVHFFHPPESELRQNPSFHILADFTVFRYPPQARRLNVIESLSDFHIAMLAGSRNRLSAS